MVKARDLITLISLLLFFCIIAPKVLKQGKICHKKVNVYYIGSSR